MHTKLFFDLIRVSLGTQDALSSTPTDEMWDALFNEAQRQAIVGVIYGGLNRLPAEQRPSRKHLVDWHAAAQKTVADNKRLNHDSVWVSERFVKVGYRNAILKGQGNALLYPDPMLRTSGDVDIWLDGERDAIIAYVTKLFPKTRVQWQEVDFPVRKDTVIEVHTTPALLFHPGDRRRMEQFFDQHREEIFSNAVCLPDEKGEINIPTTRVNLVFQLIHIYRHLFYEGIGLRQLIDYYYLLKSTEKEGAGRKLIEETAKMVEALHMKRFVGALMWVMQYVFHLPDALLIVPPDENEGRFLLSEIMMAGNFGHYDERIQAKSGRWGNFWQLTSRNWRFLTHYPREVLWNPVYRIQQFVWRKRKGYS